MECSLTSWPSISQLDDFVWTGIGEKDPFESLEQSNGTDDADSKSSSSASVTMDTGDYLQPLDTVHTSNVQKLNPVCLELSERTQLPNILQADALVTWRWDSMNATDLASVLDSTFSCQSVSSITTDEGEYPLYGDELLMEPESILSGGLDIFTCDPFCDNINVINATTSNAAVLDDISTAGKACASLLSIQEQETLTDSKSETVCDMDTPEITIESTLLEMSDQFMTQAKVQPSFPSGRDCNLQIFGVSQLSAGSSEGLEDKMKLTYSELLSLPVGRRSYDVGLINHFPSSDTESNMISSKHHCTQPDMQQQQEISQPVTNGGKSVNQGNNNCLRMMKVEEGMISKKSSRRKAVVSSRLSSQKKISRAQANRARRLAAGQRHAEGRARKCALRKLMQMSSMSTSRTCYQLSQNCSAFMPMSHMSGHIVSQSLTGLPRAQPSKTNGIKQQIPHSFVSKPVLLPIVVSHPTLTPIQAQQANPFVGSSSLPVDPNLTCKLQQIRSQFEVPTKSDDKSSMGVLKEVHINTIQRSPLTSLTHSEKNQCFSLESSVVQLPLTEQLVQSTPKAPGTGFHSNVSSVRTVKGNEFALVNESLEDTNLKQLENVVRKLNGQTRLCIRDSLYRLARSAKLRQSEAESSCTSNFKNAVEAETNSMDRWIAKLLFCKQPTVSKPQVCPLKSTEATCQALYGLPTANGNAHHRNVCGNPQDIMLCTY